MLTVLLAIVGLIVGLLIGGGAVLTMRRKAEGVSSLQAEEQARAILAEAETKKKEVLLEAKETELRLRNELEAEGRERRAEITRIESRLAQKEENLDKKSEQIERRDQSMRDKESRLDRLKAEAEELRDEQQRALERISALTPEEARAQLLEAVEVEVREEANRRVRVMELEVKERAGVRARDILTTAIQRYTSEVVGETTVSVVNIPSEEMKGRIIGREGRNIRAIEAATGVDLIIDDTPDAVAVSCFDPVRREVARLTLSQLVQDGRIHPTRIEDAVNRARREVDATMADAAEAAAVDAGVLGLHPELMKTIGRLRYRTSYGQQVLRHSVESAHIAAMIAREIGADVETARTGAFLHDLGKAIDHEVEGTHAILGAELARRFKVKDAIAHCIEAHHEEVAPRTVEAVIVMMSDAISGGRPGARRESLDTYIKRLGMLEEIARRQKGVDQVYAIQAGRELRIIVKPEHVDDLEAMRMAREVSKTIEETMEYPGQIKVTVVRETRASEIAH